MFQNNPKHSHLNVIKGFVHNTCNSFRERRCNYMALSMRIPEYVQQRSKRALNHPLWPPRVSWTATQGPSQHWQQFPCYRIQKPVQWQGKTAMLHIPLLPGPGLEWHKTCPMQSPWHRTHHTFTTWEFCWGGFLGWFRVSSDRNINFHNHLSLKNS